MSEKQSICIIGIYFGKLPSYFPIWLKSAEYNRTIDFLLFTDQEIGDVPSNVRVVNTTLEKIRVLATSTLGYPISLEKPYKLCDFRPAYGEIFHEYIGGYDYWGHCDFDMIFGDIRSFLAKHHIEKYDKFLDHGHLSLYRNTIENNHRYVMPGSKCGNFDTVFSSSHNFAFDEDSGIGSVFLKNRFPLFDQYIYADISKIHKRYTLARTQNNYDYQCFLWSDGRTIRKYIDQEGNVLEDEFIYIHFKERGQLPYDKDCLLSDSFLITYHGFVHMPAINDATQLIQKYNPYPGWLVEKIEDLRYKAGIEMERIKRRLGVLRQR